MCYITFVPYLKNYFGRFFFIKYQLCTLYMYTCSPVFTYHLSSCSALEWNFTICLNSLLYFMIVCVKLRPVILMKLKLCFVSLNGVGIVKLADSTRLLMVIGIYILLPTLFSLLVNNCLCSEQIKFIAFDMLQVMA